MFKASHLHFLESETSTSSRMPEPSRKKEIMSLEVAFSIQARRSFFSCRSLVRASKPTKIQQLGKKFIVGTSKLFFNNEEIPLFIFRINTDKFCKTKQKAIETLNLKLSRRKKTKLRTLNGQSRQILY